MTLLVQNEVIWYIVEQYYLCLVNPIIISWFTSFLLKILFKGSKMITDDYLRSPKMSVFFWSICLCCKQVYKPWKASPEKIIYHNDWLEKMKNLIIFFFLLQFFVTQTFQRCDVFSYFPIFGKYLASLMVLNKLIDQNGLKLNICLVETIIFTF